MDRQARICAAVAGLEGNAFARFVIPLLRTLYPDLNPTSDSHDLGEDAHTEVSTVHLSGGERIAILISKTATWSKLESDCRRRRETNRPMSIVVFATAGSPRTDQVDEWRQKILKEFGWRLEVRAMDWLVVEASEPKHDRLVEEHLGVEPPHQDAADNIADEFSRRTSRALRAIQRSVPGLPEQLPRDEVERIEDQLCQGTPVLLVGEPGTGKSGIAATLAQKAHEQGRAVLLLDARAITRIASEADLRTYLRLRGPVALALARVARLTCGCRFIIDHADSCVGRPVMDVLKDLVDECLETAGLDLVIVSRNREAHEMELLSSFTSAGFAELISFPLSDAVATRALDTLGVISPSQQLIELARNLLDLSLIGAIKNLRPQYDFESVLDESALWDQYLKVLIQHESVSVGLEAAEGIVSRATQLAGEGLRSLDRTITLSAPLSAQERRLISWTILRRVRGRIYRFRHDKLHEYLYARDAVERGLMPTAVLGEIDPYRTRGVFGWMDKLYTQDDANLHQRFLEDLFNVG